MPEGYKVEVTKEDIERMLGPSRFDPDELEKEARIGVVNGLAYQGSGNGGILRALRISPSDPSTPSLTYTCLAQTSRRPHTPAQAPSTSPAPSGM